MTIGELFEKGGPTIWPLLGLSLLSVAIILERLWFWVQSLMKEKETVDRVLDAAARNWEVAAEIAYQARRQPIGRFLYAPLKLNNPDPELFKLALEAAADEELNSMRRGDKILEAVATLAPLLGLLGTVLGLIHSLGSISLSNIATGQTQGVTQGIGESLISTAVGMIVAITTLAFYRLFQAFWFNQLKIFRRAGNEMELLYRQAWPLQNGSDRASIIHQNDEGDFPRGTLRERENTKSKPDILPSPESDN